MTDAPLLDHDADRRAIVEPSAWFEPIDIAEHAVITWMPGVVRSVLAEHSEAVLRHRFETESADHPIWEIDFEGRRLVVVVAGVGAPLATLLLEVLIALGCRTFVACGSAGGLVAGAWPGTVVIPSAAVRDEGTSYHYAPPATLAPHDPRMQRALRHECSEAGFDVRDGLTWTTDALFRETSAKVARRVEQGCVAVEMEGAALATVAAHRGVRMGHAVYVADTLHDDDWDPTHLVTPDDAFRRRLWDAAGRACLSA
jgi:uridine phosphorylase